MAEPRILIAGIGNIFHGDDIFGVEVAQQLLRHELPAGVQVTDFGIRSYDLAYAMLEDYDATILVDATTRGEAPGTLYLIEPDVEQLNASEAGVVDSHSMNPVAALQLALSFGARPSRLFIVGCEPATLESENGHIGLSPALRATVPEAIKMIETLIEEICKEVVPLER